jgi:hypothetical protein
MAGATTAPHALLLPLNRSRARVRPPPTPTHTAAAAPPTLIPIVRPRFFSPPKPARHWWPPHVREPPRPHASPPIVLHRGLRNSAEVTYCRSTPHLPRQVVALANQIRCVHFVGPRQPHRLRRTRSAPSSSHLWYVLHFPHPFYILGTV